MAVEDFNDSFCLIKKPRQNILSNHFINKPQGKKQKFCQSFVFNFILSLIRGGFKKETIDLK